MELHFDSIKNQFEGFCGFYKNVLPEAQNKRLKDILNLLGNIEFNTNKKLIILDLNGVLVETVFSPDLEEKKEGWHRVGKSLRRLKPATVQLLNYLFHNHFRVSVWSSSYLNNVVKTIDGLLPDYKDRFVFIWGQEMCEKENKNDKPKFWKNIKTVLEEYPQYSPDNVFIINDTEQKLEKNPLNNNLIFKEDIDPIQQLLGSQIYEINK